MQFREVRLRLPDSDTPGFRDDIARQVALINAADEDGGVLALIDAAWADMNATITAAEEAAGVPHPWSAAT